MAALITLLTDFGDRDVYVGVMKGVIAQICPGAPTIDLTHAIPPQAVTAARFNLATAYPYFPDGTVHLMVVDPGVGTQRRAIAIQTPRGFLVGPDNGGFSGVLQQEDAMALKGRSSHSGAASPTTIAAVELSNRDYWRSLNPSTTFHGRDIFAPAAAHLANGVPLDYLGRPIDPQTLISLEPPPLAPINGGLQGTIQYIDHFGNLITTIPAAAVAQKPWQVQFNQATLPQTQTYGEVPPGEPAAFIGSHGWLEIAVNGSSAWERFRVRLGDPVQVIWQMP
ncbi:Adenosyl-chloride synthase [Halomicronema hongdechloris C2206]|uniref:Adenosyl-chloride synthase n=1 Tax=Halomicronema hongdechloris C2206 TaxID=1641165 RepID=A0A1Z3HSS0_9CYAN|nr:SAM-dependent chlorinase/fluorinase [Halomicronema hongdechloris]ASC73335.1 Adenosyl-chloride synthase [Halomicronema hongdechloris C2206]